MEQRVKTKLGSIFENEGSLTKNQTELYTLKVYDSIVKFSKGDKFVFKQRAFAIFNALDTSKNTFLLPKMISDPSFIDSLFTLSSVDLNPSAKNKRHLDAKVDYDIPEYEKPGYKGMFQCGKCKSWKTTYTQAQTRSSDENMCSFFSCLNPSCQARWKQG